MHNWSSQGNMVSLHGHNSRNASMAIQLLKLIDKAIRSNDAATVTQLLTAYPNLLHVPVRSGNWGPPMSHAANMGQLDMVKAIAALGAKDFQHAFDRALLHGDIETAQWLHEQGAHLHLELSWDRAKHSMNVALDF